MLEAFAMVARGHCLAMEGDYAEARRLIGLAEEIS
jgi:hypothetical protein